jgi:DNA-binding LytR/AlgR family response regulator
MRANLRVLVADDERPARMYLAGLLRRFSDVVVVGAAATGEETLLLIEQEQPHLVLLDVHMPGLDGFGVVHLLSGPRTPLVAFVTAFDDYTALAREVGAIDYLVKPVAAEPLARTLARAHRHQWCRKE